MPQGTTLFGEEFEVLRPNGDKATVVSFSVYNPSLTPSGDTSSSGLRYALDGPDRKEVKRLDSGEFIVVATNERLTPI